MAFGIIGSKFLGSTLDTGAIPSSLKVSTQGIALTLQGQNNVNNSTPFLWQPGLPGAKKWVRAEFWYTIEREVMPAHKKIVSFNPLHPAMYASGTIRLWAESSFWGDSTCELRMWVRTRIFQPAGKDIEAVHIAKKWKKKGGKKYLHFGTSFLSSEPNYDVHTNKDLYIVREVELSLGGGEGKFRHYFGWPDVNKLRVIFAPLPPLFFFND